MMSYTMVYIIILQWFMFYFGLVAVVPIFTASGEEIHIFRWTTMEDLQNTSCAVGEDLKKLYGYVTLDNQLEHYKVGVMLPGFSTPEIRKEECLSAASIFMLIGNPGIVWHVETGQCVKTTVQTEKVDIVDDKPVFATFKFLTTGHECNLTDPTVARFKFDKKRPQRLSYIENGGSTTKKQEEWCIREWMGSQIEVVADCDGNNPFLPAKMFEVYFLEVV
ncbi:unnamed protein product [Adineta ricciae]|uniref:Uncharacterized protein n=1 Tax=Adineta ricciae TaxID=249248 RepID=A0A815S104_ADIRI|nr:unnamed protein product [Adineta ricciae]CAF1484585.1 unnamed protein product [Adineta ricciae]